MLREYDFLLRDDPDYAARAKEFSRRVRDISEVLASLPLPEMKHPINATVTYHDGSTTTYTWDAGNRLTQVTDSVAGR